MAEQAAKKPTGTSSPQQPEAADAADTSATIGEVRQLVQLMIDNDLHEVEVREGEKRIHLKRGGKLQAPAVPLEPVPAGESAQPGAPEDRYTPAQQAGPGAETGLIDITSPMVGTFYTTASPDADAFVAVGDAVGTDDVICIIEAMKVMNEIRAECAGVIIEICVKNAQPVEYGQTLFKVKTA